MPALVMLLFLSAEPTPALTSLAGLNVGALKPWLVDQLPSLAQCVLPSAKEADDEVSVQAQFSKSPEVTVTRVDGSLSDVACVRGVVEKWKRNSKQPSAGPFNFKYRFRPSAAQKEAVTKQARAAFVSMCALLPPGARTREGVKGALATTPPLPVGARVSLEDALAETESLDPKKVSSALARALRDMGVAFKTEWECYR
jgi:hypothetical protein